MTKSDPTRLHDDRRAEISSLRAEAIAARYKARQLRLEGSDILCEIHFEKALDADAAADWLEAEGDGQ